MVLHVSNDWRGQVGAVVDATLKLHRQNVTASALEGVVGDDYRPYRT
jgi:hypothetical protein